MITRVQIQSVGWRTQEPLVKGAPGAAGSSFSAVFDDAVRTDAAPEPAVRFSNHARQRMAERGIALSGGDISRIERAAHQAAEKGARQSLLLMNQAESPPNTNGENRLALVLSVANRTVITVVPQGELEDSVFTNIDSAVVVAATPPLAERPLVADKTALMDGPRFAETPFGDSAARPGSKQWMGRTPFGEALVPLND